MVKSIDLDNKFEMSPLSFLRVEWWDELSRFVLVRYSLSGKEQEFGLRLDLDKKIFLDHFDDKELEKIAQDMVKPIWDFVAWKRWGLRAA
jgi:hypothetical protein